MRRSCALWVLLLAVSARATLGASLHGTVTDPSGDVVPNAGVGLYSRDSTSALFTRTDQQGQYDFRNLAPGRYLVKVEAQGFAGLTTEEIRLAVDEAASRDLRLELAGLKTEVIVTASSTPLMFEEVGKVTDIVTAEEVALRDEYSVSEAVRLLPGFRVKQLQGPGSLTGVQVRGLRPYHTALLVDGLRMRDAADLQGSVSPQWENLNLVDAERIEVLRGSGSSLYGSHAIGGVVNVVTDRGGGPAHGEIQAEGGGLGMLRGAARAGGGVLGERLLYSGGISHLNVTRGLDDANPHRNTSGQGFVEYRFSPRISWSGRAFLGDAFLQLADSPYVAAELETNHPATGLVPGVPLPDNQLRRIEQGRPFDPGAATYVPSPNDPDSRRSDSFYNLATIFAHQLTPGFSYRASYQFLDTNRRFEDGPAGVRFEPLFNTNSTFDGGVHLLQARTDLRAGDHNLITGGYEFEHEEYDNLNLDENPDPGLRTFNRAIIRQRSQSGFAQDQVSLFGRRLQVGLSGRIQAFTPLEPRFVGGSSPYEGIPVDRPKTALTGDASIAWLSRRTGTKWRAHAGNAYRSPSPYERYGTAFFFGSFSPFGDPRLRPERTIAFDTGVDQWLAGSRVRLSATYFYTSLQETIIFDFSGLIPPDDPFGRFGGYVNFGGGVARGAEVSVSANPARGTTLTAAYTYTNSDQRLTSNSGAEYAKLPGISDHVVTLLVSQWVTRRLNVTFDLFAASNYPTLFGTSAGSRVFDMNGPVKTDLVTSYTVPISDAKSLQFFGKIENLRNSRLYEDGYRAPKLWGIGGVKLVF